MDQAVLPAAVIAIAASGRAPLMRAFPGPRDAVRPDSLFFLASVTKPIFATGVMQLVEDGLLDLDAPLRTYLPDFSGPGKEGVTARRILSHTSGVPDVPPDVLARDRPSLSQMVARVSAAPLRFQPGSHYEYVSASFYLLAESIRRVTALAYPAYLRARIFGPLGMVDTAFDPRHSRSRIVSVHGIGLDNRLKREFVLRYLAATAPPGGGLWATAGDLVRFGRALLQDGSARGDYRLLSARLVELMTRDHTAGVPRLLEPHHRDVHYGLGWGKPPAAPGGPSDSAFEHGGVTGTRLFLDPERDLVFVFLTNQWNATPDVSSQALSEVYRAL